MMLTKEQIDKMATDFAWHRLTGSTGAEVAQYYKLFEQGRRAVDLEEMRSEVELICAPFMKWNVEASMSPQALVSWHDMHRLLHSLKKTKAEDPKADERPDSAWLKAKEHWTREEGSCGEAIPEEGTFPPLTTMLTARFNEINRRLGEIEKRLGVR